VTSWAVARALNTNFNNIQTQWMYKLSDSEVTLVATSVTGGNNNVIMRVDFYPQYETSKIAVELCYSYSVAGYGSDSITTELIVGTNNNASQLVIQRLFQTWNGGSSGGGTRSGASSSIMGVYDNSDTVGKFHRVQLKITNNSDDIWQLTSTTLPAIKITEIMEVAGISNPNIRLGQGNISCGNLSCSKISVQDFTVETGDITTTEAVNAGGGGITMGFNPTVIASQSRIRMAGGSVLTNSADTQWDGSTYNVSIRQPNKNYKISIGQQEYFQVNSNNTSCKNLTTTGLISCQNLSVSGSFNISNEFINNDLTVLGDTLLNDLIVDNTALFNNDVIMSDVSIQNSSIVNLSCSFLTATNLSTASLIAGNNICINNNIISAYIEGGTEWNVSSIHIDNDINIFGNLNVSETSTFKQSLNVNNQLFIGKAGETDGSLVLYSNNIGNNFVIENNENINFLGQGGISNFNFSLSGNKTLNITPNTVNISGILNASTINFSQLTITDLNMNSLNASNISSQNLFAVVAEADDLIAGFIDVQDLNGLTLNSSTLNSSSINTPSLNVSTLNVSLINGSNLSTGSMALSNEFAFNFNTLSLVTSSATTTANTLASIQSNLQSSNGNISILTVDFLDVVFGVTADIINASDLNVKSTTNSSVINNSTLTTKLINVSGDVNISGILRATSMYADELDSDLITTDVLDVNIELNVPLINVSQINSSNICTNIINVSVINNSTLTNKQINTSQINLNRIYTDNASADNLSSIFLSVGNRINALNGSYGAITALTGNINGMLGITAEFTNVLGDNVCADNLSVLLKATIPNISSTNITCNSITANEFAFANISVTNLSASNNITMINICATGSGEIPRLTNTSLFNTNLSTVNISGTNMSLVNMVCTNICNTSTRSLNGFFTNMSCYGNASFTRFTAPYTKCTNIECESFIMPNIPSSNMSCPQGKINNISNTNFSGSRANFGNVSLSSVSVTGKISVGNISVSGTADIGILNASTINASIITGYQESLIAGDNISIVGNTISSTGSSLPATANFSNVSTINLSATNGTFNNISFYTTYGLYKEFTGALNVSLLQVKTSVLADIRPTFNTTTLNASNLNASQLVLTGIGTKITLPVGGILDANALGCTILGDTINSSTINASTFGANTINMGVAGIINCNILGAVINGETINTFKLNVSNVSAINISGTRGTFSNSLDTGTFGATSAIITTLDAVTINTTNISGFQKTISAGLNMSVLNDEVAMLKDINISNISVNNIVVSRMDLDNRLVIRNNQPTLYFKETSTGKRSGMIHQNDSRMYFLSGVTDSESWSQVNGQWPLILQTDTNEAIFGGNINCCDANSIIKVNSVNTSQVNASSITVDILNNQYGYMRYYRPSLVNMTGTEYFIPFNGTGTNGYRPNTQLLTQSGDTFTVVKAGYYRIFTTACFKNQTYADRVIYQLTIMVNDSSTYDDNGQANEGFCYVRHDDYGNRGQASAQASWALSVGDTIQVRVACGKASFIDALGSDMTGLRLIPSPYIEFNYMG